jgi:hypothetical protein
VSAFSIHWSIVQPPQAMSGLCDGLRDGLCLVAVWPSPVNHDSCFRDAGFTEFADNDEAWSVRASALLERLLAELCKHGEPRLVSKPIQRAQPWFLRPFRRARALDLREQIAQPIQWDSLPECVVAFGSAGASLRAGNGHHLYWLTLPGNGPQALEEDFMHRVSGDEPLFCTSLRWEFLRAHATL